MSNEKNYKKILLLANHCIGDSLFVTTFSRSLRARYPDAQIDVLVDTRGKMVFSTNPDVSNVISLSRRPNVKECLGVLREYGRYDLVVNERQNDRPTLYSFLFGRERLGVLPKPPAVAKFRRKINTHAIFEHGNREHRMSRMARMLEAINVPVVPKLVSPYEAIPESVLAKLPKKYLVIHTPASNEIKQWSVDYWVETIKQLIAAGYNLVLTGAPGGRDAKIVGEIVGEIASQYGEHPQLFNLIGELTLAQTSALIKASMGFVGTDSGPGHLASSYNVPIISIISVAAASEWSPWPYEHPIDGNKNLWSNRIPVKQVIGNVTVLQSDRDCVPCSGNSCKISDDLHSPCLNDITPQRVVAAVLDAVPLENH
ncbi:glycosyltransferase family 9 protein [Vibrio hippocampi]|uniref:Uncharacterized protein n=1 Tax=Vibrio hippocampi TaxID=654686 RepID=A0ABM8ZL42_9VIBR|nr:glycosyltransferase family 9 protein [Vibrio hippocampi]CAH0528968.1 hypothetical protein VHP8226_02983 [Vibrio hippocampi]